MNIACPLLNSILWIAVCIVHGNTTLLDDTLFTFQDHACDDNRLRIRCPYGTTINIQWAQYGRTHLSEEICPFSGYSLRTSQKAKEKENTQCLATSALQIVLDQCQDRRHCRLLASTTVFGQDPCPETSKYLEVAYKCRPNEFRSREICEGSELELKCTRSQRLAIYSATYGWSPTSESATKCPGYSPNSRSCESECAYSHVYSRCHGRKRCTLVVMDSTFKSDCAAGTPTYLTVIFTCVPRRILKDIDDEKEYPDPCDAALEDGEDGDGVNTDTPGSDRHDNGNHGNVEDYIDNSYWDTRPENEADADSPKPDIDGEPSYLPKPSTINYNGPATPDPEIGPSPGNHDSPEIIPVPETDYHPSREPNTRAVHSSIAGFVSDWIFAWNFIKENVEKFILYIVLGIAVGIICVLLVIICRINQLRRRRDHEAKLNISEPIANSTAAQQAETTSLLDASDPSDGGVEMTGYNQIGSLHRPPVSSFTDPYEEETPVSFASHEHRHDSFGRSGGGNPPDMSVPPGNAHQASYTGPSAAKKSHNGGGGGNGATFASSLSRPNHTRHTSFSGSIGRSSQPGMLTGSLNRRDHWTNEYRNEGHHHTLQHYYG